MKLTTYLKTKLEAWVPFEGFDGFEVKVAYLSREELTKIRNSVTRVSFNPKTRQREDTSTPSANPKDSLTSSPRIILLI